MDRGGWSPAIRFSCFRHRRRSRGSTTRAAEQVYRYDIEANELACVSCPPAGVHPSGDAYLSAIDQYGDAFSNNVPEDRVVNDVRGVSSDGDAHILRFAGSVGRQGHKR